jgi:cell division septal protein FtsQ
MIRRAKKNRYKAKGKVAIALQFALASGVKCLMTLALLSILSLAAIFAHDFVTQTPFLNIRQIDITGNKRATRDEILKLSELDKIKNLLELNTFLAAKRIASHLWIQSAVIKRQPPSGIHISVVEHEALAIVHLGKTAVLINSQGLPFKEYIPDSGRLSILAVIKGLELTKTNDQYLFSGSLFESVIQFLKSKKSEHIREISANEYMGITILSEDFQKSANDSESDIIPVKLGFGDYEAKLEKAKRIYNYIGKHVTDRSIHTMDLFDIERAFIRTTLNNTLHE